MPPTSAAAMKAASGFCALTQSSTAAWRVRSSVRRSAVKISQSIWRRRRTMAEPTMPLWPATQTRLPVSGNSIFSAIAVTPVALLLHLVAVCRHHVAHQLAKAGAVPPAELGVRLGRIAEQEIDLGRAKIPWVDLDQDITGFRIHTFFVPALAPPLDA